MKNILIKNKLLLLVLGCSLLMGSCKDDNFLEVKNLSAISSESTWSTESSSDLFLNDIYSSLPDLNKDMPDSYENWSDNSMAGYNWCVSATTQRDMTTITPTTQLVVDWSSDGGLGYIRWKNLYNIIRKCNVFIDGVENASALSKEYKDMRLGEAHTIRAFYYNVLWMYYGGVPLIAKPDNRTTDGETIFHARATSDETFAFIKADLDKAVSLLKPNNGNNGAGRITQGAALTLRGWAELFYASALKNPSNDKARWVTAAATNKLIMNLGYSLYPKYDELFFATGAANDKVEGIFYRQYIGKTAGSNLSAMLGPSFIGTQWLSWGGATPTQGMVDDYAMANGKGINEAGSGYDPQNPYVGREPRFYQSVLYNGSTFFGLPFTSFSGSVNGTSANNPMDLADGTDQTNTSYSWKKRMDPTVNIFDRDSYLSGQNYYYFRYAEVLLNYAEAQNEAVGPDGSVYAVLDQIRTRAGIPTISTVYPGLSQSSMRDVIRKERRVELAFEDKRYLDLLRWKTAEIILNKPMEAMVITQAASGGPLNYKRIIAPRGTRKFDPAKNYLVPIPQSALDQNPALQGHQNPGF